MTRTRISPSMIAMLRSARDRGDPFAHVYGQGQAAKSADELRDRPPFPDLEKVDF